MMKLSHIILISLLAIALLVGGVQGSTYLGTYQAQNMLQMHMNQTPFVDDHGQTVTNTGGVAYNSTSKAFGSGSGWFASDAYLSLTSTGTNFTFGTGNFTIMAWFNPTTTLNTKYFFDTNAGVRPYGYWESSTVFNLQGTSLTNTSNPVTFNQWHQFVLKRESGRVFLFIDGNPWSSAAIGTDYTGTGWVVGANQAGSAGYTFLGGIDEFNVWKGVALANGSFWPQVYEVGTVTPGTLPVSSFTSQNATNSIATNSTSRGWEGLSIFNMTFTDTSTGTPTTWNWLIDDVITNTTQNITYGFGVGNHTVKLNVTNSGGYNLSQPIYINVSLLAPTVIFTTNVTSGVNPLALYLNDTSTNSPMWWNTSWGDNSWLNQTSFPATNITHIYSTAGLYWINQYATVNATANGTPLQITVYGFANSQFMATNTIGGAPFTTYLYDTSTNLTPGAVSYYWMLGDGNTSTAQNLYYTWNVTGSYSVNHSMNNGLSLSWNNKSNYIVVGESLTAPKAAFYGGPQLGAPPMQVFLTDVSTNTPTSWNWSFGDGTYSTSKNPTKWYNSSGFFTVNLTATNTVGSNKTVQTNFVMVY